MGEPQTKTFDYQGNELSYTSNPYIERNPEAEAQARRNAINNFKKDQAYSHSGQLYTDNMGYGAIGGGVNRYGEIRPDYLTMRDPETGGLSSRFQQSLGSANQALMDKAMSEGDSPWAAAQRGIIDNQYNKSMGDLQQRTGSQLAQARSNLAMRGGLGSGARERLGNTASMNQMLAQQGLGAQRSNQNLNLSMQDETMKNNMLTGLGATQQNIQLGNIGRLQSDLANQNLYNQQTYAEDMRTKGAIESSKAQAAANSGGK